MLGVETAFNARLQVQPSSNWEDRSHGVDSSKVNLHSQQYPREWMLQEL